MSAPYIDREKQLRSVFVGNIPFEVTEGELREKFEQAGPIVNFRLVHDRETGKPKGYGFIEYQDQATANSCVRNLNNVEYNGRPLRVGPAIGNEAAQNNENIKALQQALGGIQQESPYGAPVEPNEAPEAISKAVSSLPPEQMFELMKQMKICIQNNPNEARNMLLQNPQLAYALLQAQIVMKIVDPQVAMALLHRERDSAPAVKSDETPKPVVPVPAAAPTSPPFKPSGGLLGERPGASSGPVPATRMDTRAPGLLDSHAPPATSPQDRYGHPAVLDPRGSSHPLDSRGPPPGLDPRAGPAGMDRGPPHRGGMEHRGMDSRGPPQSMDPRMDRRPGMDPRGGGGMGGRDPRDMDRRGHDLDYRRQGPGDYNRDPRDRRSREGPPGGLLDRPDMRSDMRSDMRQGGPPSRPGPSSQFSPRQTAMPQQNPPPQGGGGGGGGAGGGDEDKEKAALIMQVLQLTDEQIQQLPPDQRQSILILKQQIAGNR